jgi:hypothetical protein
MQVYDQTLLQVQNEICMYINLIKTQLLVYTKITHSIIIIIILIMTFLTTIAIYTFLKKKKKKTQSKYSIRKINKIFKYRETDRDLKLV